MSMPGSDLSGLKTRAPHSLREIRSTQIHFLDSTESGCFTTRALPPKLKSQQCNRRFAQAREGQTWRTFLTTFLSFIPAVARWYTFEPKIPIWVNFGSSCNGRCWYTS
jgi:hypothetical protein